MLTGKLLDNIHAVVLLPRDEDNLVIYCPLQNSASIEAMLNSLELPLPQADAS